MINQKKTYKKLVSLVLSILILAANFNLSFAESTTIYIDSANDFIKFSEKASLDTYFNDKTVILRSDIDLSHLESFTVPTFAGVFDGQGNTISGISINESGSVKGLFRYLQEDGVIKDLNIIGNIKPCGSQNVVGGLVGNNKGTITNCNFTGNVVGDNNIGGLVGINEVTGIISHSTCQGTVTGNHFTGGIVGQNLGTILKSSNYSEVNISITEPKRNINDINWRQINSTENVKAHTDTGGVAGFSTGFIQDCINRGPVGYRDMGYNVGGIVGRQSGYLYNCQNYSIVSGRKDVGGIVGQIEPYLMLLFSQDNLQKLEEELNVLQNLLNNSFKNAQSTSLAVSSQFDLILESFDHAMDNVQTLSRESVDYADHLVDTANITSKRIEYTLEEIIPILEDAEKSSISLNKGLDYMESGFDNLEVTSKKMADALDQSKYAIDNLRDSIGFADNAVYDLRRSLRKLSNSLDNKENLNAILKEVRGNIEELERLFQAKNLEALLESLNEIIKDEDFKSEDISEEDLKIIEDELENILENIKLTGSNISEINKVIYQIINKGLLDANTNISRNMYYIFNNLENSSRSLDKSLRDINHTISKLKSTSEQSGNAFHDFSLGFNKFEDSSENMTTVIVSIRDLLDYLTSQPTIELENISSEYRQSGDELFNNLGNISSQVNKMNQEIKDSKNTLIDDVQGISDQILNIFNLLITSTQEIGGNEYIEDNIDEDQSDSKAGIVYKNQNYGSVNGSINVGGIVGSMAIEYDLDPEDDILKKGSPSLNFKYLTTAILKECVNHGEITAKKDNIGGIVGLMNLGIITGSENYGHVESLEGDYVGGIAGASYAIIDKSFVLSSISGRNYIGGIVGYGTNISNSYSLVELKDGIEYIGAIAGKIEGDISNNYYVNDKVAAIDGISYTSKASPISYDELLEVENLPNPFTKFYLTFLADDNIIEKISFDYGDSFDLNLLPDIPGKEGHEASWEKFNNKNMTFNMQVEAIYRPFSTVLSSNFTRAESTLSLLLAEGEFTKDVNLQIQPFKIDNNKFVKNNKLLETWSVELTGLENKDEKIKLRLLKPHTKRELTIWQLKDTGWETIESSVDGSYMNFEMNGNSGVFAIVENPFLWFVPIILGSILLFSILLFSIKKFKRNS